MTAVRNSIYLQRKNSRRKSIILSYNLSTFELSEIFHIIKLKERCLSGIFIEISQVNKTVQILLRSLPQSCRFNIIDFGT
jgi:DNA replication protein DnaC